MKILSMKHETVVNTVINVLGKAEPVAVLSRADAEAIHDLIRRLASANRTQGEARVTSKDEAALIRRSKAPLEREIMEALGLPDKEF